MNEAYKKASEISFKNAAPVLFLKAVFISLGTTLLVFLAFSFLLAYTGLPEASIPVIALLTSLLGAILSGFLASKTAKSRGYVKGALSGLLYSLAIFLISFFIEGRVYVSGYMAVILLIGLFAGAIGGILGINMSLKQKQHKHGVRRMPLQRRTLQ